MDSTTYGYDALNRLDDENSGSAVTYTYDGTDNRLTKVAGSTTTTTVPSTSNKISAVGADSYSYDNAGNITDDGTNTYVWSAAGLLKQAKVGGTTVGSYLYDAQNRRTRKIAGGVTTHYVYGLNGLLYGEYTSTGTIVREYVYLNDEPLAQIHKSGGSDVLTYLHNDHLGTPRLGTNTGGTGVWSWTSDGFGVGSVSGSRTVNLRMPGQYYDSESELFYNWNRYYNPAIGRYISSDPIGIDGGLNTFLYAAASPVMYSDPEGLFIPAVIAGARACGMNVWCRTAVSTGIKKGIDWAFPPTPVPADIVEQTCPPWSNEKPKWFDEDFWEDIKDVKTSPSLPPNDDDPDNCAEEWEAARERCSDINASPPSERPQEIWGGSYDKCVKGQVSQRCGGNRVN